MKKYIKNINAKEINIIDILIWGALIGLCFILFQHNDIHHTGVSSYAFLKGHFLDFYEYNAEAVGGCAYLPTTYIMFAIWNIPLKILGCMNSGAFARMWFKLGTTLLYAGTCYFMYKIVREWKLDKKSAMVVAFLFASNPIAVYSQFCFGQYDIITTFFMVLGLYFYLKDNRKGFVAAFAVALTCKYFSLLVFMPLLFFKEKKVINIIRDSLGMVSLFVVEQLIYWNSEAFHGGVNGFGATGYVFRNAMDNGFTNVSLVILAWVALCVCAYFKEYKEETLYQDIILYTCVVMFIVFGLSFWHPQWLLMMIPFVTLVLAYSKHVDVLLLVDTLLGIVYMVFTCLFWPTACDQGLFRGGIFKKYVLGVEGNNFMMHELFPIDDADMLFSIIVALILVYPIAARGKLLNPENESNITNHPWLIRLRYLVGGSFFLVSALICLYINFTEPNLLTGYTDGVEITSPFKTGDVYEQVFIEEEDTVLGEVQLQFATYLSNTNSEIEFQIVDVETDAVLYTTTVNTKVYPDNKFSGFEIEPYVQIEANKEYKLIVKAVNIYAGEPISLWAYKYEQIKEGQQRLIVNGEETNHSLNIKLFGFRQ